MKKPLTLFQKIVIGLISIMLLIILSNVLLRYLFEIRLEVGRLIIPLIIVGMVGLYTFFSRKKLLVFVLFCIMSCFLLIYVDFTKDGFSSRRSINASEYSIEVNRSGYSIIKYYDFAEKIIAQKKSNVFFDQDSKMGIDMGYQVKILKETPDSLYVEINSSIYTVDSLKKRSLWSYNVNRK